MALIVTGYVDGDPVYYEETEPTTYETTAEVEDKSIYDVEITAEDDYGNASSIQSLYYVSGEWIEPIVDRILQDISEMNSRAYLNYWDLNRIEQDTEYLSNMLNGYGYNQSLVCKTDWLMSEFPYAIQMERVRTNIQKLINAYHAQDVLLPATLENLNWIKINSIESNLKFIKEMIHRMEESFRYSGTFYSGQGVSL